MQKQKMIKYAQAILISGVRLKKGQPVVIFADVNSLEFINILAEEAFKLGASEVEILYSNEIVQKARFEYAPIETFGVEPKGKIESIMYQLNNGACIVNIVSSSPDLMNNADSEKLKLFNETNAKTASYYRNLTNASLRAWCIAGYPSSTWAKKIFPNLSDTEAVNKLWDVILHCSHADGENPSYDWFKHAEIIKERSRKMNQKNFTSLHFTSKETSTDIKVGLCEDTIWGGGYNCLPDGTEYTFNMPTEEILAAPHKDRVDGMVYSSKPLSYFGNMIEDFWFKFKNGTIMDFGAKKGYEFIKSILDIDEGARHLGEVALVPFSSPINKTGLIFYNTLFDENAVCHFAIGAAYSTSVGGKDRSAAALAKKGMNTSLTHVDFMFGTGDMMCVGTKKDGSQEIIMKNGEIL